MPWLFKEGVRKFKPYLTKLVTYTKDLVGNLELKYITKKKKKKKKTIPLNSVSLPVDLFFFHELTFRSADDKRNPFLAYEPNTLHDKKISVTSNTYCV